MSRPWTPLEYSEAIKLSRQGLSYTEIGKRIGRSDRSIEAKFRQRDRVPRHSIIQPVQRVNPSDSALLDRDRRAALKHGSVTALFCGDPLPGYSALDQSLANSSMRKAMQAQSDESGA